MQVFKIGDSKEYHLHYKGEVYKFEAENDRHAYGMAKATMELADMLNENTAMANAFANASEQQFPMSDWDGCTS